MTPSYIWHLKGNKQDGPNVVILGGTHGNEATAVELIRRLLAKLDLLALPAAVYERKDITGNLFVGFGNPEAILRNSRGASTGRDLNRSFSQKELATPAKPSDRLDLKRARELAPLLKNTDFLFDIHATSSPSEPAVCFGSLTQRHKEILSLIPVKFVITDPDLLYTNDVGLEELGTSDGLVNDHGGGTWSERNFGQRQGLAICYETGFFTDMSSVDQVLHTVASLLKSISVISEELFSLLTKDISAPTPIRNQEIYAIAQCVTSQANHFNYEPGLDQGWQQVRQGQKIGEYDTKQPVYSPCDGLLLFQRGSANIKKDNNLFCLARRID